jgi:4-aminobutyrate aminotransferase-like enzyme
MLLSKNVSGVLPDRKTLIEDVHAEIEIDHTASLYDDESSSRSSSSSGSLEEKRACSLQRSCSPPTVEADYSDATAADKAHVWHHMLNHKAAQDAHMIVSGKGLRVWDSRGREFLDVTSGGLWTVNVGYGREEIANAVR